MAAAAWFNSPLIRYSRPRSMAKPINPKNTGTNRISNCSENVPLASEPRRALAGRDTRVETSLDPARTSACATSRFTHLLRLFISSRAHKLGFTRIGRLRLHRRLRLRISRAFLSLLGELLRRNRRQEGLFEIGQLRLLVRRPRLDEVRRHHHQQFVAALLRASALEQPAQDRNISERRELGQLLDHAIVDQARD